MADAERLTLNYLPLYRCIAGECRENCCAGLHVQLSADNHAKLLERSRAFPQLKAKVDQVVKLEPEGQRTSAHHSYFETTTAHCSFLDPDYLCSIQRNLGEDTLSDACSTFPRVLTQVGERLELSGTLACPEIARLCLTSANAVELVPWQTGLVAREIVVRRLDEASTDPYVQGLDEVRRLCLQVASTKGMAVQVQLLLLVDLAERIKPFFHEKTSTFDPARLQHEVDLLSTRVGAVASLLEQTPVADARAVHALKEIFLARLPGCDNPRFNALVRPMVLKRLGSTNAEIAAYFTNHSVALDDATLHTRYVERRARLAAGQSLARADEHIWRFATNSLIKDWYTQQPTLGSTLRRLIIRACLSRFATFLHPSLAGQGPISNEQLDEAAVDGFQIVAKNIEHVPSFMQLCEAYLVERGLDSTAGLALLLAM